MKKLKKAWIGLIVPMLFVMLGTIRMPENVLAYAPVKPEKEVSLTVETELKDVTFVIYRVAAVSETADYTPTEQFAGYSLDFTKTDSGAWRALASTLDGYVQRDQIKPLAKKTVDADGKAYFTGLKTGLYLVTGELSVSFLVSLPQLTDAKEWDYHPSVIPKSEPETAETEYSAVKIWKDKGHEKSRPASVTVQLLENGRIYEEVKLNEKNGWQHTWKDLKASSKWTVTEKNVPKGYTVSVSREGKKLFVTNTYRADKPQEPGKDGGGKLPQTGQLWWPAAVLAIAGVFFIICGLVGRKKEETYETSKK